MLSNRDGFQTDEYGPPSILPYEAPVSDLLVEPDRAELRKYLADREARLARTWDQIAAMAARPYA
jgi:hypothetical protein